MKSESQEERQTAAGSWLPDPEGVYAFDPAQATGHLRVVDPRLAYLMERVGPFSLPVSGAPTVFAALSQSLVYQQLSRKAAATIFGRVRSLFGADTVWLTPEQVLSVDEVALRSAGMSRAKAASVLDLAQKVEQGLIPPLDSIGHMADEEIVSCLTQVRGIGRWTAEMFLIFRLGRPDVFPIDDVGMRNGFRIVYESAQTPDVEVIQQHADRWRPFRTVATWYLWQALEIAWESPSRTDGPPIG